MRFAVLARIGAERHLFNPAMNASFFEGLQRSGLRMGQAGLDAAFGKDPAASTGLHKQKLDATASHAVADGGNLFASGLGSQAA